MADVNTNTATQTQEQGNGTQTNTTANANTTGAGADSTPKVKTEEEIRAMVHQHPVDLFGHPLVKRPQSGLDMSTLDMHLCRRQPTS